MKRAIRNLEQLSDIDLFETLSEGMPLIVDNATSLDETARHLYRDGEFRASEVMRGFAEEEAAKVLILIDYARCPRKSGQRSQVLNRFYGHVAKRIHAMACEYPRIASFGELDGLVERECLPWHLDGPNDIDWIFPNEVSQKRERDLYVDYVQDVTDGAGACFWISPAPPGDSQSQYVTSDCVILVQSLSRVGAVSAGGLEEIAHVWRDFAPKLDTDREELRHLIAETMNRLARRCGALDESDARFIARHWPYPLWKLTIREPRPNDGLDGLREERERTIKGITETEAKRDPAPAISRSKVEKLNDAYTAWRSDVDAREAGKAENQQNRFVFRTLEDFAERYRWPSYVDLQDMFRDLTGDERAALLALGWFARERVADWPRIHERAVKLEPTTDENYQISCACYWLAGLERWEEKPRPFQAGRLRRRLLP